MSNTPHGIAEEFPAHREKIHALKLENALFAQLLEAYRDVNRAVHRAETGVEPVDDATLETMKKKRLALKDEIAGLLAL
jgi:uncharacterized protein YdcH (DUF465 family)